MNSTALTKAEIVRELSLLPDSKLDKIRVYIETVLLESKVATKHNRSLQGIWQDKGFEKIIDLEAEIRQARKRMGKSILKRKF